MSNILIAGAGYGGLTAAINLANKGYQITVVEAKSKDNAGHDWHDCMNINAFKKANVRPPEKNLYSKAKTQGFVNSGSDVKIKVNAKKSTILIDRKVLTKHLIECAQELGVCFNFDEKITKPLTDKDNCVIGLTTLKDNKEKFYNADLVIDAAGLYSPVRKNLPKECGIQNEFSGNNIFHIFRGYYKKDNEEISNPSYLLCPYHQHRPGIDWISIEKEYVDILIGKFGNNGKLTENEVKNALDEYRSTFPYVGNQMLRGGVFADIPLTKMLPLIVADGYAAVGDSAGMTMPLNGCGIAFSMQAGKLLADAVIDANGVFNLQNLWKYQYNYYNKIGKNLILFNRIKNLAANLDVTLIDTCFEKLSNTKTEALYSLSPAFLLKLVKIISKNSGIPISLLRNFNDLPLYLVSNFLIPKNYEKNKIDLWHKLYNKL